MKIYKRQNIWFLKIIALLIINFSIGTTLFAQQRQSVTINGKVTDEKDAPLNGVTIQVKKSNIATTTDENGNFSITVPDKNAVLVFTYVGFDKLEATAGSSNRTVQLKAANNSLGEVVVVGYGTQRKVSVTGAVDRVSGAKAVDGRPVINAVQALEGQSPNLIIQQRSWVPNGGNFNINIRGTGTTGNNDPLVVIDGIIGGNLSTINPSDIDNISILKDAGSAAIYGSRSANGVILITTKKGKIGASPSVNYSGIYGTQVPIILIHPVSAYQNALDKNMSLANSGSPAQYTDAQLADIKAAGDGNWRLETILHNAPQLNQNISISGGSPTSTYLMSFGYFNQESNLEKSQLNGAYGIKRYNFRLNQTAILGKFNTGWNLAYIKSQINEPVVGDPSGLIGDVFRAPLTENFQDDSGRYTTGFVTYNPLDVLRQGGYRFTNNDEVNGSFNAGYSITPDLKITATFGGIVSANTQLRRQVDLKFYPTGEYNNNKETQNTNSKSLQTNTSVLADYTKTFGKSHVSVTAGVENESYHTESNGIQDDLTDILLGVPTTGTIVNAGGSYNSISNNSEYSINSFLARARYSFADKYFLESTIRGDASSKFAAGKRLGYFPSVSGAWRITEENFMGNYRQHVGDLKLKASYGTLGNQNINPYQFLSTFNNNNNVYAFNNNTVSGATRNLANPDITWERAATFDIGLEGTLLTGRLNFGFDYFSKVTSNILASRQDVPTFFGSGFPSYNTSKVQDRGWEAKLTYSTSGAFSQNISFNIANATSKLLAFSFGQTENVFQREEFEFVRRVGYPITVYQGYKTNGLYQSQAEIDKYPHFAGINVAGLAPGDWKFVDKNGDGVIDTKDKFVLGDPFPHYTFGFNYNASYKGFDVTIFIQGVLKRVELIRGELIEPYHFTNYGGTVYESSSDFWTPQNTGAKYPRIAEHGTVANTNDYRTGSDMYLFNTAYARLKNLQIGYTFPSAALARAGIKRARIYATGQNLITVSPLKFADPENTEFGNNLDNTSGANSPRSYTTPRIYAVGLDLTF
ncbi:MAG: TonB-dependent receptor [Bacteroidota bacterium]|nr:TonB-dependent receptor [Bacteroidota bacterium]